MNRRMTRSVIGVLGLVVSAFLAAGDDGEFEFYLDAGGGRGAVLAIDVYPDEAVEFDVVGRLRTAVAGEQGIDSYAFSVQHDDDRLELVAVTITGTDIYGTDGNDGLSRCGFFVAETVDNETGRGFAGYRSGYFVSITFLPPVGDFSFLFARYIVRASAPDRAAGEGDFEMSVEFRDGLRGSGQPVNNFVSFRGNSVRPTTLPLELRVRVVDSVDFVRGDANFDRTIDISDPVSILRSRFSGDARVLCDDAGDANDDGVLDVSDAAYLFNYLFRGGSPPPPPFPQPGPDPTDDELSCRPPRS